MVIGRQRDFLLKKGAQLPIQGRRAVRLPVSLQKGTLTYGEEKYR
jgi:hypothetical protein